LDKSFGTMHLSDAPDVVAPDGSDVRVLLQLGRGSMAHFELAAGRVSQAVAHRSVEEIWFILHGHGQMWRRQAERQETVPLNSGTCVSIPAGTHFQFRADSGGPLAAVAVTMPPWPGPDEAYEVPGAWPARSAGLGNGEDDRSALDLSYRASEAESPGSGVSVRETECDLGVAW
jgi:mannose-6-phosphate isomerase-like protein (cupin superfamily)